MERNINNLRYVDDTILMGESEKELNSLLMKEKQESVRAGLKLNVKKKKQKTKIMSSGPINSWQIEGEKVEAVTDFLFLALKLLRMVTAAMKSKDNCFSAGKLWQT